MFILILPLDFGIAYFLYSSCRDGKGNMINSIDAFHESLKYIKISEHPTEYARTQEYLGNSYKALYLATHKREDLVMAITCFQEALRVYRVDEFPTENKEVQRLIEHANNDLLRISNK